MLKLIPGNAQHIGARKEQQDSFGFSDTRDTALVAHGGLVAAVADGMGGLEGGQQSSSIAIETFMAAYAHKTPKEPVPAALRRSLLEANRAVLEVARQSGTAGNTGTTFAAAAVHNDLLYWIATGDSRIYLLRDGVPVQVNADHTYGTTLWPAVAAGHISRESALNDPQAPHLTSHLGMEELAHMDLSERPFPLQDGDVVVVCSDGIYHAVSDGALAEAFRAAGSPSAACSALQASVLAKGSAKQDNLTVLAIECRDPNPVPAAVARPAVVPAAARPAATGPSNLVLASLFCVELLMAAGLGSSYARSHWGAPPLPQGNGAVTVEQSPRPKPALNNKDTQSNVPEPDVNLSTWCADSSDPDKCLKYKEKQGIPDGPIKGFSSAGSPKESDKSKRTDGQPPATQSKPETDKRQNGGDGRDSGGKSSGDGKPVVEGNAHQNAAPVTGPQAAVAVPGSPAVEGATAQAPANPPPVHLTAPAGQEAQPTSQPAQPQPQPQSKTKVKTKKKPVQTQDGGDK